MKNLHTDEGKEWLNSKFAVLMKRYGVNHYVTYSGKKAVLVERFNTTLKDMMWRKFTERRTYRWVDVLRGLVDKHNGMVHRTMKIKPKDVTKKKEGEVMYKITGSRKKSWTRREPKFAVGDKVRVSQYKKPFDKGYLPNWTNEIQYSRWSR